MAKEFVLNKKQVAFLELIQSERRCGFVGGIRSGKTIAGSHAALRMIIERPNELGAIFSPTFPQLSQMTLKEFKGVLEAYGIFQDVHYVVNVHPKDKFGYESKFPSNHKGVWSFWNGAQIYTFSLESFYRGAEFGWAWGDEIQEASEEDLTTVLGRMSGSKEPRTFYTYTPPRGNPYIDGLTYAPNSEHAGTGSIPLIVSTTHDNKSLAKEYLDDLEIGMDELTYNREVLCRKVSSFGFPWLYSFKPTIHISEQAVRQDNQHVYVSFDFNNNPYVCVLAHRFRNERGKECLHYFDAIELNVTMVEDGTMIQAMCQAIRDRTPIQARNNLYYVTGDRNGRNHSLAMRVGENNFTEIMKYLQIGSGSFKLFNQNPEHADSRTLCNAIFSNSEKDRGIEVRINPKCKNLILDCQYVQAKNGSDRDRDNLVKDNRNDRNQQADFMDAMRYDLHAWHSDYLLNNG